MMALWIGTGVSLAWVCFVGWLFVHCSRVTRKEGGTDEVEQ